MLIDYLDQVSIIHLPGRSDRYGLMARELAAIGVPLSHPKVDIPHAPMVDETDGFPSVGVRGNFLSHLAILRRARDEGCETVMVLEDDAIFRRSLRRPELQDRIVATLRRAEWGLCYLGHNLTTSLHALPRGLVAYDGSDFEWAHCYIVHASALARLIAYLEETVVNPPGSPRGGRMYIDAALCLFREMNPDVKTLVANPALSVQRGSPSSLGTRRFHDRLPFLKSILSAARRVRDEVWRRSGRDFTAADNR